MNSLSLILRILAVIAAIASGVLFYLGTGKLAEQKAAMEAAQAATVVVQGELGEANEQIATLEENLAEETRNLSQTKRDLENTRSEMYTARQEVSRTQQQLSQARENIADLEDAAKDLRSELVEVEQNLTEANQAVNELAALEERFAELQSSNAKLNARIREFTDPTPKSLATDGNQSAQTAYAGGVETTVQSVSKESGMIVLANNSNLRLALGKEATIIQDANALGKISITQITKDLVGANILPGARTGNLSAGSTVKVYY